MGAALLSNKAWHSRDSPTDSKDLHNLWALLRCNAGKRIRRPRYLTRSRGAKLNIRPVHQMQLPLLARGHKEAGRQHSVGLSSTSTRERRSIFLKYLDRVVRIAKSNSLLGLLVQHSLSFAP